MPGTFCPLNRFGITDYATLQQVEASLVHRRQVQIEDAEMPGNFGSGHLRKIHWFLFRDVFPWAGEFRVVGLAKPGGAAFAAPQFISSALKELTSKISGENLLHGIGKDAFAACAAFYLGENQRHTPVPRGQWTHATRVHQAARGAGWAHGFMGGVYAGADDSGLYSVAHARRSWGAW